ncbi:MAG: hypothetical protein ABIG11_02030 [bacterium]
MAWGFGAILSRSFAQKIENPRLSPPPKEVPPDFFFPFLITREVTPKMIFFDINNRQRQKLCAEYPRFHETVIAASLYSLLFFHVGWSILAVAGKAGMITGALNALPGGRFLASLPELFFLPVFATGLLMWAQGGRVLKLTDTQGNMVIEAFEAFGIVLLKDGKGKEIARLKRKKPAMLGRDWLLIDTENQPVLEIRDEHPGLYTLRRLFGHMGGAIQARYGFFHEERRAGFVMRDPSTTARFQVHLDFAFSRLANPAQLLTCVLYLESKNRDPFYPSIL